MQKNFKISDGVMKLIRKEFDEETKVTDEKRKIIREHADKGIEANKI